MERPDTHKERHWVYDRMKPLIFRFIREKRREILLYAGFIVVFAIIFELYNVRTDAVRYAFLLSVLWLLGMWIMEYVRLRKRYRELKEAEAHLSDGTLRLPVTGKVLETEYQRLLEKIYEQKQESESATRIAVQEMTDYYSMWVHQVKTPIAALRILLQAQEQEEDEHFQTSLREMKMEIFKIEQYVEMVLTYLRMETMSSDLVFAYCSLDHMVRQAVRKYSQMFILKKIKLNYTSDESRVLTDEKWMVFVLEQILSNALKYTKGGSVSIYRKDDELVIEDTGIGIYPEDLPRVFERGFTGYNGRGDKKSTGIGLYLCKLITEKLSHTLRIESTPGEGTKVYVGLTRPDLRVE